MGVIHMDATGGVTGALAAITALQHRKQTGKGIAIDFAQIQSVIPQLGEIYMDYAWNGRNQWTLGNRHPTALQGCYTCRGEDQWINITINNDQEWKNLCRVMGNPPWTHENRFSDQTGRYKNHDEFDRLIEDWTIRYDNFELFHILQQHGVPAGPVYTEKDTYNDPQLNAREFFEVIFQKDVGTYRYPGFLWKMSETPMQVRCPPCGLGEHNEYVFREILGLKEEDVSALEKAKIIGGNRYVWV
jgi:crotonobetainyl-CoA:carnitine CoA-transferase CaiB-like acyl-CoA transferase